MAIVGAGPGGLECALALVDAGRDVSIWDAASTLGGGLALAGGGPHRKGWLRMIDFYRSALAGRVQWHLGETATRADLDGFDAVIAAIGATEDQPADPGAFAWSSSAAIAAGPAAFHGSRSVVVVDDGFGWWPSVSAVEVVVEADVREYARHARDSVRDGHPAREPDAAAAAPRRLPDHDPAASHAAGDCRRRGRGGRARLRS